MEETPPDDRRRHPRTEIGYPIRFKLFSRDIAVPLVDGYLKDISASGARIVLDDARGHYRRKVLTGLRTKLQIALPEREPLQIISVVRWAKPSNGFNKLEIEIGVAFVEVEPWQLEQIHLFMAARHTDQTMLWSLWDAYQQGISRQP